VWWNGGYYACGEFTALTPGSKIAFTWHGRGEPQDTRVQVSLAVKNDATVVTVAHAGVGSGKLWARTIQAAQRGWTVGLENLKSVIETGQDLRFVRRPMLGINVGEVNAEIAAKLNVPVTAGIRLDGVVEGMGAQAAGLQKDDVIVSIGGKKVTGWPSLVSALQPHRAGDQVTVVFYRGSEKKAVKMELSRRRLPEIPSTTAALAETVRKMYAQIDADVSASLEGVSEVEASHRPAPDGWSVKETLAHLIIGERENHAWIADLINDDERWSDGFKNPTNVPARVGGTAAVFSTVPALVEELKRTEAETVAMLDALPAELMAHKDSYWRLSYNLLQAPDHVRDHIGQIHAAVEAARKS
jgi:membrane-associated protease RseP (regulator of RpoE activity)